MRAVNAGAALAALALLGIFAADDPAKAQSSTIPASQRLRTFLDLSFNGGEGEFSGLEITLAPYTGGTYVLWREGTSRIPPPRLLPATAGENGWTVELPSDDAMPGEWSIEEKGRELIVRGPRGAAWTLELVQ